MKFRKKPVVIEAWPVAELLAAASDDWRTLPEPVRAAYELGDVLFLPEGMDIRTLESTTKTGLLFAPFTDMLICGVKGELYPCKPDIFAATYEPVGPEPEETK